MLYTLTDAAKIIIKDKSLPEDKGKSEYRIFKENMIENGIFEEFKDYNIPSYKGKSKVRLTNEFKEAYPIEANKYFKEIGHENFGYQLKMTEEGVQKFYDFILKELEKELF